MIKGLRERTSRGHERLQNALTEAEGDIEGGRGSSSRRASSRLRRAPANRAATEAESSWVTAPTKKGVIVEVNCQTDFVARGDDFKKLVNDIIVKGRVHASPKARTSGAQSTRAAIRPSTRFAPPPSVVSANIVVRRWDALGRPAAASSARTSTWAASSRCSSRRDPADPRPTTPTGLRREPRDYRSPR